jgi:hypothetical protein
MQNPTIKRNPSARPQRSNALTIEMYTAAVIAAATMLAMVKGEWPAKELVAYGVKL